MKILGEGFRKATLQTEYEKAGNFFRQEFLMHKIEMVEISDFDFVTFNVNMEFAFVKMQHDSLFNIFFYFGIFFMPQET